MNFFNKFSQKNDLKSAFSKVDEELVLAEKAFGRKLFPEENLQPSELAHYKALGLNDGASFDDIKTKYFEIKSKYDLNKKYDTFEERQNIIEINARADFAFSYFKQKFKI